MSRNLISDNGPLLILDDVVEHDQRNGSVEWYRPKADCRWEVRYGLKHLSKRFTGVKNPGPDLA